MNNRYAHPIRITLVLRIIAGLLLMSAVFEKRESAFKLTLTGSVDMANVSVYASKND